MTGPEGQRWTWWHEMLSTLVEVASVGASADTRLRKPLDLTRPRYPERSQNAAPQAEVAAFFGLVYVPADPQEETEA